MQSVHDEPNDDPHDEADEPPMVLVHRLRAITVELDALAGTFARRNGLHPTDLRALICLLDAARADTPATPGLLATRLGLNSAGTTALVDRLERLGHVRRDRDTADRRRVLLSVTPAAVDLGQSFFGPLIAAMLAHAETFDPAELAVVRRFLDGTLALVTE
ncbi:MarR family winged helix-turn-helix transcriptional regulator [Kitasatospora sp. McL0602]|uniref:MarR family winged helix-turn-helix transcriptional regulator n=1 Tax=Kitasatospora sp. McL0602 TaxID=3439530 RepID=UPI003F88E4C4